MVWNAFRKHPAAAAPARQPPPSSVPAPTAQGPEGLAPSSADGLKPLPRAGKRPLDGSEDATQATAKRPRTDSLPPLPPEVWTRVAEIGGRRTARNMHLVNRELRDAALASVHQFTVRSKDELQRAAAHFPALHRLEIKAPEQSDAASWLNVPKRIVNHAANWMSGRQSLDIQFPDLQDADLALVPSTVRSLTLTGCTALTQAGLDQLLKLNLHTLVVQDCGWQDEHVQRLLDHPTLFHLGLPGTPISPQTLAQLLVDRLELRALDLTGCQLTDEHAIALSQSRFLQWLNVSKNAIGWQGAQAIFSKAKALKVFDISENPLFLHGAANVWPEINAPLQRVVLNKTGDLDEMSALHAFETLGKVETLRSLDISGCRLRHLASAQARDATAAECIRALSTLPDLKHLSLRKNDALGPLSVAALAELPSLRSLDVSHNPLGNASAPLLQQLKSLHRINLYNTGIDQQTIFNLAHSKETPELREVWSSFCDFKRS